MNFLAHIYLSGDDDELTIGNFIADAVKGKEIEQFSARIQTGIHLHREIDRYTDTHSVVARSKQLLWDKYRHYAAVIMDIFYDHFLAKNWVSYSDEPLEEYVANFYNMMTSYQGYLPDKIHHMLPYMIKRNWLLNYANFDGVANVMYGMSTRTSHHSKMEESIEDLKTNYSDFEKDFFEFFPELEQHCSEYLKTIK